jgi:hypothetical protein
VYRSQRPQPLTPDDGLRQRWPPGLVAGLHGDEAGVLQKWVGG